jgi:phosphoglycerate dehydrogenase-like enzyme
VHRIIITPRSFPVEDPEIQRLFDDNQCEIIRITGEPESIYLSLIHKIRFAEAVIAGLEPFDENLLSNADCLKVISRYGVGTDRIDLQTVRHRHIALTVTPGANTESVADMAFALMLSGARHIPASDRALRMGLPTRPVGSEVFGKTLGIAGFGRIGKAVAKRAAGFSMRILYWDVLEDPNPEHFNAISCDWDTLLEESDFISIHLPLTPQTKNLFCRQSFEKMKRTAVLINTARGGIIREEDLYHALKNNIIQAAGLDVTEAEPPLGSPLLTLDNCILTNHLGATTREAVHRMGMMAAQNAIDVLAGRECPYQVDLFSG